MECKFEGARALYLERKVLLANTVIGSDGGLFE